MASVIRAGDVRQVTINGREFDAKGGEGKITITVGKQLMINKADPTGNGRLAVTQNRKLPGFKDLELSIDDSRKDLEYLQNLSNLASVVPVNITVAGSKVYSGQLVIIGDVDKDYSGGTTTIEMRGEAFEQI